MHSILTQGSTLYWPPAALDVDLQGLFTKLQKGINHKFKRDLDFLSHTSLTFLRFYGKKVFFFNLEVPLTDSLRDPLVKISSYHCQFQTGRARELKFLKNVHATLCVMCHVSSVTCHMSPVICHLSPVTWQHFFLHFFFIKKRRSKKDFFSSFKINWTKWWSWSVEGLLSTGPTPSSF